MTPNPISKGECKCILIDKYTIGVHKDCEIHDYDRIQARTKKFTKKVKPPQGHYKKLSKLDSEQDNSLKGIKSSQENPHINHGKWWITPDGKCACECGGYASDWKPSKEKQDTAECEVWKRFEAKSKEWDKKHGKPSLQNWEKEIMSLSKEMKDGYGYEHKVMQFEGICDHDDGYLCEHRTQWLIVFMKSLLSSQRQQMLDALGENEKLNRKGYNANQPAQVRNQFRAEVRKALQKS